MNLLFIAIHDLQPLLNCYGNDQMHTPNIDRLAARGVRFDKAFCQFPVCGASRASLMTGLRPRPGRFEKFYTRADEDAPGIPTIIHHLKSQGYQLHATSTVFHSPEDYRDLWDSYAESQLPATPEPFYSEESRRAIAEDAKLGAMGKSPYGKGVPPFDCADIADEAQADGEAAQQAVTKLAALSRSRQPFMYAYGSLNVHLPFRAPKRYWDLYDRDKIELSDHAVFPDDVPDQTIHEWAELRQYVGMPLEGPLSDDQARTLTHGYMADISYLDAQIGKLIRALDDNGLAEDTAIVLWVDHGFSLGEHGLWSKHTVYETSLAVPLIMHIPWMPETAGTTVTRVVENLDIYPTVCDILDLPKPDHLQGRSLMPLIGNPDCDWDAFAFSRGYGGESIRTDGFRYSEWPREGGAARVLFDHRENDREEVNLADNPEFAETISGLAARMAALRQCP